MCMSICVYVFMCVEELILGLVFAIHHIGISILCWISYAVTSFLFFFNPFSCSFTILEKIKFQCNLQKKNEKMLLRKTNIPVLIAVTSILSFILRCINLPLESNLDSYILFPLQSWSCEAKCRISRLFYLIIKTSTSLLLISEYSKLIELFLNYTKSLFYLF